MYAINIICRIFYSIVSLLLVYFLSSEITGGNKTIHFELGLMKGVVMKYAFLS